MGAVAAELWDWSKSILGDLEKHIKWAKHELGARQRGQINDENIQKGKFAAGHHSYMVFATNH